MDLVKSILSLLIAVITGVFAIWQNRNKASEKAKRKREEIDAVIAKSDNIKLSGMLSNVFDELPTKPDFDSSSGPGDKKL